MSTPETQIAQHQFQISRESEAFELIQRQAKMLASSTLIPKEFQGNMANCAIGLNIAKRLGADPFMVLQNIDIIHGRPGFRASFLIAMVNASGRFTPLKFIMIGAGMEKSCQASATYKESGETVTGPAVSMKMAKDEGWYDKAGSKWKTIPDLMLHYRAGAFFARIYAPDITLGMQTAEEIRDVDPSPRAIKQVQAISDPIDPFAPQALPESAEDPAPEASAQLGAIAQSDQDTIRQNLADQGVKEMDFIKWLAKEHKIKLASIAEMKDNTAAELLDDWQNVSEKLNS